MKVIFYITVFLFVTLCGNSQNVFLNADTLNYPYAKWTAKEIKTSITTTNASYLSETEKEIIILANLARINPKLFSKTFLLQYITDNNLLENTYVKSLRKTLKRMKRKHTFIPDEVMFNLAKSHAVWSGKKGRIGHQNFSKRSKKSGYNYFAENCQYGYNTSLEIYFELLIDDGIPSLGHRENFLSPNTKYIGVSIQPHKKYDYNCVIDFGGN